MSVASSSKVSVPAVKLTPKPAIGAGTGASTHARPAAAAAGAVPYVKVTPAAKSVLPVPPAQTVPKTGKVVGILKSTPTPTVAEKTKTKSVEVIEPTPSGPSEEEITEAAAKKEDDEMMRLAALHEADAAFADTVEVAGETIGFIADTEDAPGTKKKVDDEEESASNQMELDDPCPELAALLTHHGAVFASSVHAHTLSIPNQEKAKAEISRIKSVLEKVKGGAGVPNWVYVEIVVPTLARMFRNVAGYISANEQLSMELAEALKSNTSAETKDEPSSVRGSDDVMESMSAFIEQKIQDVLDSILACKTSNTKAINVVLKSVADAIPQSAMLTQLGDIVLAQAEIRKDLDKLITEELNVGELLVEVSDKVSRLAPEPEDGEEVGESATTADATAIEQDPQSEVDEEIAASMRAKERTPLPDKKKSPKKREREHSSKDKKKNSSSSKHTEKESKKRRKHTDKEKYEDESDA